MHALANMIGFYDKFNILTQGQSRVSMQFDHYAPVSLPPDDRNFPGAAALRAA
jgi:translation elongation factor EF-G